MSRHQIPRHARKRLTIAAIAATALIGTTVTVGIMGSASAGEETQAASEQCVSKDQNGEQQSNLPPGDGDQQGDDQQGDQQAGDQQGDQQGDDQQGDDQQGGDQQGGDQQDSPVQTYGVTAPQAAHPDNPMTGTGDGEMDGNGQMGGGQQGDDQQGDDQQGGDQQGGDQQGGDQQGGDQQGDEQAQCVGPFPEDFVDINTVEPNVSEPQAAEGGSTGVFTEDCGNNEDKHQNTDNIVIAPGKPNGAEHLHDYVGNLDHLCLH